MPNEIFDSIKMVADEKEREIMQIPTWRARFLKMRELVDLLRGFTVDDEAPL
jgi:hypothetical protein